MASRQLVAGYNTHSGLRVGGVVSFFLYPSELIGPECRRSGMTVKSRDVVYGVVV
jgi:hypothetical protein